MDVAMNLKVMESLIDMYLDIMIIEKLDNNNWLGHINHFKRGLR